jgi:purine nucleoside phosphorylase
MGRIAIIAGTGFRALNIPDAAQPIEASTPFGQPSGPILRWMNLATRFCFLPGMAWTAPCRHIR